MAMLNYQRVEPPAPNRDSLLSSSIAHEWAASFVNADPSVIFCCFGKVAGHQQKWWQTCSQTMIQNEYLFIIVLAHHILT